MQIVKTNFLNLEKNEFATVSGHWSKRKTRDCFFCNYAKGCSEKKPVRIKIKKFLERSIIL